jgi:two-component system, cell cycle response regulator
MKKPDPREEEYEPEGETTIVSLESGSALESTEQAYLIVLSGSRMGSMVRVSDGMTIGRGNKATFQVNDDGVSRFHVKLTVEPDGSVAAEDLSSRNGTFINGEKIARVVLKDGDKIQMGVTTILKFSYADEFDEAFQQRMYEAAIRDPLTGIYNRRYLNEQMANEFAYSQRHRVPVGLIIFDIDHFKLVNDQHGHPVGDEVLVSLTRVIARCTRAEDLFARYGGEEFALVCRESDAETCLAIADRLRATVAENARALSVPDLRITLSGGVASHPTPGIESPEQLFEAADRALYQAKALGRNRVCCHKVVDS